MDLTRSPRKSKSDVELGRMRARMEPQIGSSSYRALYSYQPQNSEDLQLSKGEWVTLLDAPYGGEWWKGKVEEGDEGREGWFPKSYVEYMYVDEELERQKVEEGKIVSVREEICSLLFLSSLPLFSPSPLTVCLTGAENFKMAAAAIVAASSSFSLRHGSMQTKKLRSTNSSSRLPNTISKKDIDSTPKLVTKFDQNTLDAVVIENERHEAASLSGNSQPETPRSQRGVEVITNHVTSELTSSQDSSQTTPSESGLTFESYVAKYNYVGGTDIELALKRGEEVRVIGRAESGWWQGMCGGKVGWFPASYVKPAPSEEPAARRKQQTDKRAEIAARIPPPRGMEESMSSDVFEATGKLLQLSAVSMYACNIKSTIIIMKIFPPKHKFRYFFAITKNFPLKFVLKSGHVSQLTVLSQKYYPQK